MSARKGSALSTITNPAYDMMKQRGGEGGEEGEWGEGGECGEGVEEGEGREEGGQNEGGKEEQGSDMSGYEQVDVSQWSDNPFTVAADVVYEIPSPRPLPIVPWLMAPPIGGDVGVAEAEDYEVVYDNIQGDQ